MAVFFCVFDVIFGDVPSGVADRRNVGLYGAEPFRQSAEVSGFGAQDFAPVLVQESGHFSRVSDCFVGVGVKHSSKGVGSSRKERAHFLGDLLFPVIVDAFGTVLFFSSKFFNLLECVSVGKLNSENLDLENVAKKRFKAVTVGYFGDSGK